MTSLLAFPDTPNPDLTATVTLPREPAPEPYARPDNSPPAPELSAPPATSAPASEGSVFAPDSLFYASPQEDPPPTPEPSLLAPTSLFYAPPDRTPPPPSTAAEPLLAPTSLYYAATHRAPITAAEPSIAAPQPEPASAAGPPRSPTVGCLPTAAAEPPNPPSDRAPASAPASSTAEPPHSTPTLRRTPDPVLVTTQPHDPTAADRRARLVLHHASEPGDALLCRLVARFGAPTVASAILSGSAADLLPAHEEESASDRAALIGRANTLQTRCYRADPDADLAVAAKTGARYVIPADEHWPTALDDLGDAAPLGMWFLGSADLVAASQRGVSIVGARIATGYGMHVAGELAAGLAERGWAVISGAARGIDGAAHRGALAARGVTVAALACGIDLVYPAGHEALIGAIASDGLVLSELPPGTSVSRFRFLDRNRVIAALGLGTVVVEAAARSGSLVTARLADGLGRPVLAIPGPVTSEASEGTHQLIRDGALLITRAAEVIEQLGDLGADLADPTTAGRSSSRRPRDSLDPIAARVLDALPVAGRGTLDTVEAALAAGLEPRAVHAALGRLTAAGWVDRDERGWCARLIL
jgi:DNA processing protein